MTIKPASDRSQSAAALQSFYLKTCAVSSDFSVIKYVLKWIACFGSQTNAPEVKKAINSINTLQTGVTVGNLARRTAFGTDFLTWLNTAALAYLRLKGLNLVSSASLTSLCAKVYSATFMAQSVQYFKTCLTKFQDRGAENAVVWRLADSVNSLVLGAFYLFFDPSQEVLLTFESADIGFGVGKRNLFPEKKQLDKLSSAYLPGRMLA